MKISIKNVKLSCLGSIFFPPKEEKSEKENNETEYFYDFLKKK